MLFRPALFLALATLVIARPNPSSLKTIASATGSKSSIKSPSQKLAEKNSPSVASILESSVVSQGVSQTEALSALPQGQDLTDSALQYSQDLVHPQPAKVLPVVVKESEILASSSSVQNEVVKPISPVSTYANIPVEVAHVPVQPVPVQSVPVQSVPVQPVPVQPVPVQPVETPVQPQVVPVVVPVVTADVQSIPSLVEKPIEPVHTKSDVIAVENTKVIDTPIVVNSPVVQEIPLVKPVDIPVQSVPVQPIETVVHEPAKVADLADQITGDKQTQVVSHVRSVVNAPIQPETIVPVIVPAQGPAVVNEVPVVIAAQAPVQPIVESSKQAQPELLNSAIPVEPQVVPIKPEAVQPSPVQDSIVPVVPVQPQAVQPQAVQPEIVQPVAVNLLNSVVPVEIVNNPIVPAVVEKPQVAAVEQPVVKPVNVPVVVESKPVSPVDSVQPVVSSTV